MEREQDKAAKQRRKEEGRRRARLIAAEREKTKDPATSLATKKTRSRHGARNQHRHKHFARWLLDRFPQLRHNGRNNRAEGDKPPADAVPAIEVERGTSEFCGHVLDIACGKGELSARLAMCHNLSVVAVDPREADFAKVFEDLVVPKLPKKWQERIQGRQEEDPQFVQKEMNTRVRQMITCFDEYSVESCEDLKRAISGSCLMIGLHADNATEAIVDAALQYRKPFVVVPCCVFPRLFSSRVIRGEDGRCIPVRTHEQFCQFLIQKDPRLIMEKLPFEGRNIAIWWNGEAV